MLTYWPILLVMSRRDNEGDPASAAEGSANCTKEESHGEGQVDQRVAWANVHHFQSGL